MRSLVIDLAAGRFDSGARTLGDGNAAQGDLSSQFAGEIDLNTLGLLRNDVGRLQRQQVDDAALNLAELVQTYFRRETHHGRIETDLGQPALQRHLTAFETDFMKAAGTRALAFVAATAGLAEAGADASAAALGRLLRARRWFEVVQAHDLSFLELQHVGDLIDHAAIGRGIVHNNGVMAAAQAQAHDTGAVGMTSAEKAAQ